MNRILIYLLLAALPVQLYGQISAPESVDSGEAIHFTYPSAEAGDELRWLLLNPFDEVKITEIQTRFGTDFIVDPPCGWAGKIRIQVIVLDADKRVKAIEIAVVDVKQSEKPIEPPIPPPNPDETDEKDDENKPKPAYDGLNQYGMGQVAYENCPKNSSYSSSFIQLMEKGAGHLRGYDGLKVVKTTGSRAGTSFEIYVWLDEQLKNYPKEWQDLYKTCESYRNELGVGVGTPVNLHYQLLLEIAAGVRANQKVQ